MAEFVMKKILADRGVSGVTVLSRALHTDALGCNVYYPARKVLETHGVPYERRSARLMTQREYDEADLVVVMDEENYADAVRAFGGKKVIKLLSAAGESGDVADPWYTGDFERTYADVYRGCSALAGVTARRP